MNKIIQKLMEQSMEPNGVEGLGGSYSELNYKKFADLIVLECANYASRNWEHGHLLAQDLKTHFGFE
jgi:glycerol-3-phosphate dehydrogenase